MLYIIKKLKVNKTFVMTRAVLPLGLLIIYSLVMSFSLEAGQVISMDEIDSKTDGLFHKLGIVKKPHIAPPVDIHLKDINGQKVAVSEFKGKIVFLNFWTTWCHECRIEMPSMEKLLRKLKGKDFEMIAVNLQEPASRIKHFLKSVPLTFTILLDTQGIIAQQFGIRAIPTTFILDKNGGIIGKALGSRHWNRKESIDLFEHLMNRVVQNTNSNEYEQKKGTSSNLVRSDTGVGNTVDDPAYTD
jgi:peroxiredoxin